jgi:hypothetical protein
MFAARNLFLTASAVAKDLFFRYVTMLLPGNGTNGKQNNTFLDSSTNNFTITRNGNTTQGTFSPYGSLWSNYFDGSGDYLQIPNTSALNFDGQFCVEGWVNFSALNTQNFLVSQFNEGGESGWLVRHTGTNLRLYASNGAIFIDRAWTPTIGVWYHFAVTRDSSNNVRMFVDGSQIGTTATSITNNPSTTAPARVGGHPGIATDTNAYLSNIRVVKGSAVYTSNFTPSTSPLTAITNTSLLTCQSNRFIDNSTNAFAITRNGDVGVQRFSPFNPTASYTPSTDGGSGYFDGSGDYLTTPTSSQFTASGNFTVSCWFMLNSFANSYYVVGGNWDAGTSDEWLIQIQNNGAIRFLTSASTSFSSSGVVKLNEWTFFSATRSGSTVTVQVNGTTVSTYTKSDTLGSATKSINIGQQPGNNWPWNGYISDFRLVSGSAVTTLPTSPLTAISGTGLLLNFTNAGIIDNAEMNNLETVGNAQISTAQSKFGGGSMYFDGNGDYCLGPTSPSFEFGSGDFTIEAWLYRTADSGQYDSEIVGYGNPNTLNGWHFGLSGSSGGTANRIQLNLNYSGYLVISSGTIPVNTWTHVAVTRSGTSFKVFINGNQDGSATSSATPTTTSSSRLYVGTGAYDPGSVNRTITGYIDDLRITKGVARYTANFTPPSAPFPTQ